MFLLFWTLKKGGKHWGERWEGTGMQGGQEIRPSGSRAGEAGRRRRGRCRGRGFAANLKPPLLNRCQACCSSGPVTLSEYPWGKMTSVLKNTDFKTSSFFCLCLHSLASTENPFLPQLSLLSSPLWPTSASLVLTLASTRRIPEIQAIQSTCLCFFKWPH